jgi:hypothetical protein
LSLNSEPDSYTHVQIRFPLLPGTDSMKQGD